MQSKKDKEKTKKPYDKPRLRTIELTAEEVLAVGCKFVDGGDAPGPPTCEVGSCNLAGS